MSRFGGPKEMCNSCNKTVYVLERFEIQGKVIHRDCFKCSKCKNKLSMGNFSTAGEKLYCTPHFKQLFREKGSYDFTGSALLGANN